MIYLNKVVNTMEERKLRTAMLIGEEAVEVLKNKIGRAHV